MSHKWLLAGLLALVIPLGAVSAGWLDSIALLGKTGRRGAGQAAGGLEQAVQSIKGLPQSVDRIPLAVSADQGGHWRLVNRAGEVITAANTDELSRSIQFLAKGSGEATGPRLALYLAEETVLAHRALLGELPRGAELHVATRDAAYPLLRSGHGETTRAFAELHPRVLVELASRAQFEEAIWQLGRPFNRANVRVISFQPGGPVQLSSVAKFDLQGRRTLPDVIEPDQLRHALPAIRAQTALVTGRVEGDLLHFKPASGPELSLLLKDLVAAAAGADVNLVILRSASPRQPGARTWLWQTVEVENLSIAIEKATVADFLASLKGDSGRMLVTAKSSGAVRVELEVRTMVDLIGEGVRNPVTSVLNDALAEVTAKVLVHGVTAHMRSAERERELERRLIPGVPADAQQYALGALFLGLLALSVSRRWFARIWPAEERADYGGAGGYYAAVAVRLLAFALIFLPLAGPFCFLARLLEALPSPFRGRKPASAA